MKRQLFLIKVPVINMSAILNITRLYLLLFSLLLFVGCKSEESIKIPDNNVKFISIDTRAFCWTSETDYFLYVFGGSVYHRNINTGIEQRLCYIPEHLVDLIRSVGKKHLLYVSYESKNDLWGGETVVVMNYGGKISYTNKLPGGVKYFNQIAWSEYSPLVAIYQPASANLPPRICLRQYDTTTFKEAVIKLPDISDDDWVGLSFTGNDRLLMIRTGYSTFRGLRLQGIFNKNAKPQFEDYSYPREPQWDENAAIQELQEPSGSKPLWFTMKNGPVDECAVYISPGQEQATTIATVVSLSNMSGGFSQVHIRKTAQANMKLSSRLLKIPRAMYYNNLQFANGKEYLSVISMGDRTYKDSIWVWSPRQGWKRLYGIKRNEDSYMGLGWSSWSPDGNKLIVCARHGMYVYTLNEIL